MSQLVLHIIAGPDKNSQFPIQEGSGHMLGRHQEVQYKLTDPRTSRRHCELRCENEEVKLIDLGSTGGTFVNGNKVSERVLKPGDVIMIGELSCACKSAIWPMPPLLPASVKTLATMPKLPNNSDLFPVEVWPTLRWAIFSDEAHRPLSSGPRIPRRIARSL